MQELEQEIKQAIEKNLPKQLGEVLQKRLIELERREEELKQLKDNYEILSDNLDMLQRKEKEFEGLEQKQEQLKLNKDILLAAQIRFNEEKLKYQLDEANKRANAIEGFVATLVKNKDFVRIITTNTNGFDNITGKSNNSSTFGREEITEEIKP